MNANVIYEASECVCMCGNMLLNKIELKMITWHFPVCVMLLCNIKLVNHDWAGAIARGLLDMWLVIYFAGGLTCTCYTISKMVRQAYI